MRHAVIVAALALASCTTPRPQPTPAPSPSPTPAPESSAKVNALLAAPSAMFHSGFEDGVTLTPLKLYNDGHGDDWAQSLKGGDQGPRWDRDLPQRENAQGVPMPLNRYTNAVAPWRSASQVTAYAQLSLDTLQKDGASTTALKFELKKQDPNEGEGTRVQYGIYPEASLDHAYLKYRLRLQDDLNALLTPGVGRHGLILTETKSAGSPRADYRWNLYAQADAATPYVYWRAQAQDGDSENDPQVWECTSKTAVPIGKWMTVEVFWHADPRDGQINIAVDGTEIVHYLGRTMRAEPVYVWWAWKLYVGKGLQQYAPKTFKAWVDDVELYADRPATPIYKPGQSNECRRLRP